MQLYHFYQILSSRDFSGPRKLSHRPIYMGDWLPSQKLDFAPNSKKT